MTARTIRAERHLMAAEYFIDSTNTHVRNKKCRDVQPLALRRYTVALNHLRAALQLIRNEQGARHPTLFAGSADPGAPANDPASGRPGAQGRKQKGWGSKTPHGWSKDCENGSGRPADLSDFDLHFERLRLKR